MEIPLRAWTTEEGPGGTLSTHSSDPWQRGPNSTVSRGRGCRTRLRTIPPEAVGCWNVYQSTPFLSWLRANVEREVNADSHMSLSDEQR